MKEPSPVRPLLILIVDDNELNLKLARDLLRASGFETFEASTGLDAIRLAAERRPDAILMDLRLPDMDGTDAARRLRADARTAAIPVVAMSATPLDPGDDWFLAAGFDGYLPKPIDVDTLPDELRAFCARRAL